MTTRLFVFYFPCYTSDKLKTNWLKTGYWLKTEWCGSEAVSRGPGLALTTREIIKSSFSSIWPTLDQHCLTITSPNQLINKVKAYKYTAKNLSWISYSRSMDPKMWGNNKALKWKLFPGFKQQAVTAVQLQRWSLATLNALSCLSPASSLHAWLPPQLKSNVEDP